MNEIYTRRELNASHNLTQPTCYSCRWSIGSTDGLLCKKKFAKADMTCPEYMREVGADEPEEV